MLLLFIVGMLAGSGTCALAGAWWWRARRKRQARDTWLAQQFWTVNGKLDALTGRSRGGHPSGQGAS